MVELRYDNKRGMGKSRQDNAGLVYIMWEEEKKREKESEKARERESEKAGSRCLGNSYLWVICGDP